VIILDNDKLTSEKIFNSEVAKSKEYLKSMSALDLMSQAVDFHKQLIHLIDSFNAPPAIIIGILTSEAHRLSSEQNDFKYLSAIEMVVKYAEKHDNKLKKYVDDNFMKKE